MPVPISFQSELSLYGIVTDEIVNACSTLTFYDTQCHIEMDL